MDGKLTTRFTSRGRLAGVAKQGVTLATGQNGASPRRRSPAQSSADEALYYRARLILGDSIPRPDR